MELAIEVDDYTAAGNQLISGAELFVNGVGSLCNSLWATAGMAGNDPIGSKFAHKYDQAAQNMLTAFADLASALETVAVTLIQSGSNHQAATAYSCIGGTGDLGGSIPAGLAVSPGGWSIPSSNGSTTSEPDGWHLVMEAALHGPYDVIGFVWPNGSESLLDQAMFAWVAMQGVLVDLKTQYFTNTQTLLSGNTAPEIPSIAQTVSKLTSAISLLVQACADLSSALGSYADDIAKSHVQMAWEAAKILADIGFAIITVGIGSGAVVATISGELGTLAAEVYTACGVIGNVLTVVGDVLDTLTIILSSIQAVPVIPNLSQASSVTTLAGDPMPIA